MLPTWTSDCGTVKLWLGDCLDVLPTLTGVSLVCTDPPYHGVKDDDWDNQWDTDAAFLAWVSQVCGLFDGVLAPNGSLYWFASPQMAARVECEIRKTFNVLNPITWDKGKSAYSLTYGAETFRKYVPSSERIIFAERYNSDNAAKGEAGYVGKCDELRGFMFEPIVRYLRSERAAAGVTNVQIDTACGWKTQAFHYFAGSGSNFNPPTETAYDQMRRAFPGRFIREYEDLRREYEDLRREYEDLRRPFSVTARDEWGDVWRFPIERNQVHPTQKPLAMMAHIVKTSSLADGTILDPFMGSGTTGVAAVRLGRKFYGCEIEPTYFEIARKRIEAELNRFPLLEGIGTKQTQKDIFDKRSCLIREAAR